MHNTKNILFYFEQILKKIYSKSRSVLKNVY